MPTKKEAEYAAAMFLSEQRESADIKSYTLKEAMEAYIALKGDILSPSTIRGYKTILRTRLKLIQPMKLYSITNNDIQLAINKDSLEVSPKTVANINGFLSAVMQQFRPEFHMNVSLPRRDKKEANIPTDDEVIMLLDATQSCDIELYKAIILGAYCGLRRGEILALKWNDIDFENKEVSINKALVKSDDNEWTEKNPKSFSGFRKVPLMTVALNALEPLRGEGNVVGISGSQISDRFSSLVKRLKIRQITFHNLRHYYASVMLAIGMPDKYAMDYMGHATNYMLKTVYQHTMDKEKLEFNKKLDDYFNKIEQ